jgi:hypothetical protein
MAGGFMFVADLLDCLGFPNDAPWIAQFTPKMVLEKGPAVSLSDARLTVDVDCTDCLGVIVNTWTTFAQRRYSLFIKRGDTDASALSFPLGGGIAQLKVSGDFVSKLHFELAPSVGAPQDIAVNICLLKIPPPTPAPAI